MIPNLICYHEDWTEKKLVFDRATSNKLIVMLFRKRLKYSSCYQKCRRAFLKFPYFRSYFKYQYLAVYTSRWMRARICAEYRKRFVGRGREREGRRARRNVRASRHRRTLRLHPIPRFYSLIPLCSPPGSQGDFYSSLRISTLTSRHPQPSLSLSLRSPSPFPRASRFHSLPYSSSFSFLHACSSYPLVPLQVVAATLFPESPSPVIRSAPFVHPPRDNLEST